MGTDGVWAGLRFSLEYLKIVSEVADHAMVAGHIEHEV